VSSIRIRPTHELNRTLSGVAGVREKTNFANARNMFGAFKPRTENNSLFQKIDQVYVSPYPARQEGRYGQSSPDAARDAMAAMCAKTRRMLRTAKSCGPDSPTLESSLA
jgi:hypothetical protein